MANETIPRLAPGAPRLNAGLISATIKWRGPLFDFIFKPAQRKRAYKSAMTFGAGYWIGVFMPLRFTKYAELKLGYRSSKKWDAKKQEALGFVRPYYGMTGPGNRRGYTKMINTVFSRARVQTSSSTTTGQKLAVIIPYGHPLRSFQDKRFRFLPYWEIAAVAKKVATALDYMLQNPTSVKGYKPPKPPRQTRQRGAPSTRQRK
jgi:hypothetical protein